MPKAWHLGDPGERDADHLLSAYELGEGFQVVFVLATDNRVLEEVRQRLSGAAPVCRDLDPGRVPDGLLEGLEPATGPSDRRPVLWLQSRRFDPELWRISLAYMQRHRERIRREVTGLLVVAGPPELLELAQTTAPDLWSIRIMMRLFQEKAVPAPRACTIRWLHLSDFHFEAGECWDRRPPLRRPSVLLAPPGPVASLLAAPRSA